MERRRIGSLEVSVAGPGCNNFGWRIGEKETKEVVDAALGTGVNLFDTADMYDKSEEFLGNVIGTRRKDMVLTTKFGSEHSRGKDAWGPQVFTEQNLDLVESLTKFSEAHNRTILELAIGWLLARDTVPSVITGATSAEQVKRNAASAGWRLTPAGLDDVEQILLQPA